jgi:hypothetical protein
MVGSPCILPAPHKFEKMAQKKLTRGRDPQPQLSLPLSLFFFGNPERIVYFSQVSGSGIPVRSFSQRRSPRIPRSVNLPRITSYSDHRRGQCVSVPGYWLPIRVII